MRIKLVTFAPHPNYGTCLQGYALNYIMKKLGHDVEFIYNRREERPKDPLRSIKRIFRKCFGKPKPIMDKKEPYIISLPNHPFLNILRHFYGYNIYIRWKYYRDRQRQKVYKFTFLDDNFKMRRIYTRKEYSKVEQEADLFVTGSDQIWNPYCGGYNPMMFLEFVHHKPCVAYASSISLPEIPVSVQERMKNTLSKFKHIGVREYHSVDLLNTLLGRNDVKQVVDPTYLLTAEEWADFGKRAEIEFEVPEKFIFCYFVGSSRRDVYQEMVEKVKEFTGIEDVITLDCYTGKYNYGGGRIYKDSGPYEWVNLLQRASYVCMDSFHATVFAMKFRKEFVHALKNKDEEIGAQNTRMYDLLNRYGLTYKLYNGKDGIEWHKTVDYDQLEPVMNKEIEDSIGFLKRELGD